MEEVPRRTSLAPLATPCFLLCFIGVETEGVLDYQGRAGIISIVLWNLRPQRGPQKSPPEISSQKLADFECRFPYDFYGRDRAPFWPFLEEGFWVGYFCSPCDRDPPTENFKNFTFFKNALKELSVYFWGDNAYFY